MLTISISIIEGGGTNAGGYIFIVLCGILILIGAYYLYQRAKQQAEESTAVALASAIEVVFSAFDCDMLTCAQLCRVLELTGIDTLKSLGAELRGGGVVDQKAFKVLLETSGIHGMVLANQLIAAVCTIKDEDEASDIAEDIAVATHNETIRLLKTIFDALDIENKGVLTSLDFVTARSVFAQKPETLLIIDPIIDDLTSTGRALTEQEFFERVQVLRDPTENDTNPKKGSEDPKNCPLDYVETRKKIRSFRGLVQKLQHTAETFRVYHSSVVKNGAALTEALAENCKGVVSGSIEHMQTLEWIAKLIKVVKLPRYLLNISKQDHR